MQKFIAWLIILCMCAASFAANETYYVDVTSGDDGDTGLTEELAWATLAKAADTADAGDTVYVKASARYYVEDGATGHVATFGNAGSQNTPIVYIGYTSTVTDGGVVTIDADTDTTTLTGCIDITAAHYMVFRNFKFTGGSGMAVNGGTFTDGATFVNCEIMDANDDGIGLDNYCTIINCSIHNNGACGIDFDDWGTIVNSVIYSNTSYGINANSAYVIKCRVYSNGDAQYKLDSTTYPSIINNNVFDGDDTAIGLYISSATPSSQITIINNVFVDNTYHISSGTIDYGSTIALTNQHAVLNNCFYSSATADENNYHLGVSAVEDNPDFTNLAEHDYTLTAVSPCIGTGLGEMVNIGWDQDDNASGGQPVLGGGVVR